jgi:hypothetical protein
MTTNIYLFKKKSGGDFVFYKIPLTANRNLLTTILNDEETNIQNSEVRNYVQIYSSHAKTNLYYSLSTNECSEKLIEFIKEVILHNADFPSIATYKPRSDSKDKFPFKGIVILKKEGNNFVMGIHSLTDKLKLYKHSYLGISFSRDDYTIEPTNNLFLIPTFVSCLTKGSWDNNNVSITSVHCRSKYTSLIEDIFEYKEKWKNEANSIKTSQTNLIIEDNIWTDFTKDVRNNRKFVRCFKTAEGSFENVRDYYNITDLRNLLGFTVQEENGEIKVNLQSEEQVKNFLDAFRKHIFENPISNEFCKAEHIEKLS